MTYVIDGVFFQLARSGIARVWQEVLPLLPARLNMPIVFLDRAGEGGTIDGVEIVPFPSYKLDGFNPADSELLEKVCRFYGADVFTSTYYTTPMQTPSLAVVYDMIPELFDFDLSQRYWREKETSLSHAQRHVCISHQTRKDLLKLYPEFDPDHATVAYPGVSKTFRPASPSAVARLRTRFGLERDYFVLVGSRAQHKNYKNAALFFDAVKELGPADFDILCVGGEETVPAPLHEDQRIIRAELNDTDLATAYGGAAALIFPSLYEGFGLPVAEAMRAGCPVITTQRGSLAEVAGDAAWIVDGTSREQMAAAIEKVRQPAIREQLIASGSKQGAKFTWEKFADKLAAAVTSLAEANRAGVYRDFYRTWSKLRTIQAEVDVYF